MIGVALSISSCSSSDGKPDAKSSSGSASASTTPAPSQSQSSTSDDPQAADKRDVLEAYGHYWEEQVKAYSKASIEGTKLTKYATADALGRAESDLMSLDKAGIVAKGKPVSDAEVAGINMDRKVPQATITDCLDVSKWTRVDRKTGKTVPPAKGQLKRYTTTVEAEKWGKQWMILKATPKARAC